MRKIFVLSLLFIVSGCTCLISTKSDTEKTVSPRTTIQYKTSNPFSDEVYIWENWQQSPVRVIHIK